MLRYGLLALLSALAASGSAAEPVRPNVLLLVADDLGHGDVGCDGCKDIPTPNIDRLARDGVRCTAGYVSAPVCSPCRAGMITGRYQTRFGHEFNPPGADKYEGGMPQSERTMANYFRDAGYVTGHIGKWHLGNSHIAGYAPGDRGFQEWIWYGGQKKLPPLTKYRNGKQEREEAYINDAMAQDAAAFIDKHRQEPWFLYVPFLAVHEPLDVPDEWVPPFAALQPKKRPKLAALLVSLDKAIGAILARLSATQLDERTLVVFLSDNGSYPQCGGTNTPFRGRKGCLHDGGIHIPFILRWKGALPAGKEYTEPVIALDLLPTALAAAGTPVRSEWKLDGVNLLPYLQGAKSGPPHAALYWRYGEQMAIRSGDWKLVRATDEPGAAVPPVELYNLGQDPGESKDLAATTPAKVRELQALWQRWNAEQAPPLWGGKSADGAD